MKVKSGLIISGIVLVAALGLYWALPSREPSAEELYRQYMELSPFEQFNNRDILLKKAAEKGYTPAILQMANDNFINKKDLQSREYDFWIKKAADQGDPQGQLEAFNALDLPIEENFNYLLKAAGQSYGPALWVLGRIYASGDEDYHIVRDEQKALKLFRQAADANMPEALYLLYLLDRLNIFPLAESRQKEDIYQRYLEAAKKEGGTPYPSFNDIQELTPDQCRRISNFLQEYMKGEEKIESIIQKLHEEMSRTRHDGHQNS